MSGSPIPRLITSTPAARLAAILRSSSANRYGGILSRRLLGRMQLLDEIVRQGPGVDRHRPAAEGNVQILPHLDRQLAAVEHDRDGRIAAVEYVRDRRPGGTGPARCGLSDPALEDPGPDPIGRQDRVPRHVGPVRKQGMTLESGADLWQLERVQFADAADPDRALRVAALKR